MDKYNALYLYNICCEAQFSHSRYNHCSRINKINAPNQYRPLDKTTNFVEKFTGRMLEKTLPGDLKTQGTASRYARRKQHSSTKVRAAAGVAVKLATACALQQRFVPQPVLRSSWLQRTVKGVPLSSWLSLVSSIPLDYICKLCITRKTRKNETKPVLLVFFSDFLR